MLGLWGRMELGSLLNLVKKVLAPIKSLRKCATIAFMRINADLTKILGKENDEKWVALSQDRRKLIASSESLQELRDRLGERKNDFVYMKVLRSDMEFAFSGT